MTVYFIVFVVGVVLASIADRHRQVAQYVPQSPRPLVPAAFSVGLLLTSVAALRWHVGTDYWTYESLFPTYVREAQQGLSVLDEPGLRVIAWVANEANGDGATMLAIAATITVGLTVRTIWRWSPAFAFSIAIYLLSGSWHYSFNGVRQYLACAILFAGHRYIVDRRVLHWLAVVLFAALFHISALVGVLMYLVPTRRLTLQGKVALFALAIGGLYLTDFALELLTQVTNPETGFGGYAAVRVNPLRVGFTFLPLVVHWLLPVPDIVEKHKAWFYVNMLYIYAAAMLATSGSAMLARFVIYPQVFLAIGIVYVTALRSKGDRMIVRGILLVLFAVFWYIEVSGTADLREFQWIFNRG